MEIEFNQNTWRISEFANKMNERMKRELNDPKYSQHMNTVDRWFVDMENAGIHYVNRVGKKRAYQQEDLEIACFIAEVRDKHKILLNDIYRMVGEKFDVREFPEDLPVEHPTSINPEELREMIVQIVDQALEGKKALDVSQKISEEVNKKLQEMLPAPADQQQEKDSQVNSIVIQMESEFTLEEEAIAEWNKKPAEERTKKAGMFRREEDLIKRDEFIRNYKKKHLREVVELKYSIKKESAL